MNTKSLIRAVVTLMLLLGLAASPALAGPGKTIEDVAAAPLIPLAALRNADGTLNTATGLSGTVDLGGWNVTLDPTRGPLLASADRRLNAPNAPTATGWSLLGDGVNDIVKALVVDGSGNLYVGGTFTTCGDGTITGCNRIAKWDGSNWSALGSGLPANVNALALRGTDLYVGGNFRNCGGNSCLRVAKWDTTATTDAGWSALGAGVSSSVTALAVDGTDLYVGGLFTTCGDTTGCNRVAKWDTAASDNTGWTPLGSGVIGAVNALAVSGSDLYVGGLFTTCGDTTGCNRVAKWDTGASDNTGWSALGSGVNDTVFALALSGTDLYVGGVFSICGITADCYGIAKWDTGASTDAGWTPLGWGVTVANVNALVVSGSDLYVGGLFTDCGAITTCTNIAKWDTAASDNTGWATLDSGVADTVNALVPNGSDLYVGGEFTTCGVTSGCNRVALYVPPPSPHTVTYDGNGHDGGTLPTDSNDYFTGDTVNVIFDPLPTKTGYTFDGWSDGTTTYTPTGTISFTMGSADVTLTAVWESLDDFIITVKTDNTSAGSTGVARFRIPTDGVSTYSYYVDCNNDGIYNTATPQTGDYTCVYGSAGTYTVRIKAANGDGTGFPHIYFNNSGDRLKLLSIEHWGTGKWTSMRAAFYGCSNLSGYNATDTPDLTLVTDMSYMFNKASAFNGAIGGWDTTNVTDVSHMFQQAMAFNQDIGDWETANITDMSYMFTTNTAFNQDIGGWDTTNVTNTSYMFAGATAFNQNLDGWETANVTNMRDMFNGATNFDGAIGSWDTANVANMDVMFQNASAFNQYIGDWDTTSVTAMPKMFDGASAFNQDISNWKTAGVTDMSWMFQNATAFNQDIGGWETANVTSMYYMFAGATAFDQDLGSWDVSKVGSVDRMFFGATLSTANYDALLIGWDAQALQPGLTFHGGSSTYCAGESARTHMTTATASGGDNWGIIDGGLACGIVWDGGGSDSNWSTALNWVGDTVPGAGDRVTFNGTSSKDAVMDATFGGAVAGVILAPEYGGTLSFARSLAVGGDYSQYGGAVVIDPAHAFTVEGSFIHAGGALQETRDVGASSAVNFLQIQTSGGADVYRGVDLDTTSGSDLGSTTVTIKAVDLTSEFCTTDGVTSPPYANRCFSITPTNNLSATLTLWVLTNQLPGGITTPSVYHYSGGQWVELSNIATGTAGAYTWASGDTTGFSPFLIAQSGAGTNAPTALTLQRFAAHPVTGFLAGGVLLGLVVLALGPGLALGLIPLRHHHSQKGDSR